MKATDLPRRSRISRPALSSFGSVLLLTVLLAPLLAQPVPAAQVIESDLCIYGGTSGGVIAAVQAARLGKSVVIAEPGRHLGGMTSGGLGATDRGNVASIGGLSREFYRRVGQRYGTAESFTFEPHVAEETFQAMLREVNVPVHFQQRLASVTKQGQRITEIVMENGNLFRAKMFLDTTYEGDLLAAAGVSFTVGREATNTYGEPLNGIRPSTPSHQFAVAVSPYVTPGDTNSGLLPFIQPGDGGRPGEGDERVQAYNFRLCLTQAETNKLPIAPPPDYDAGRYELLGRYIQARVAAGHSLTLGSFMNISVMPNGKTDINNNGAFSTDYIGMNYTYATNAHTARAVLWQEHEDYIRGFLTFLATDARVPALVRTNLQLWGLCRDEFSDTGGWPHQLYVREARRMVSDYVMIQSNCAGTRVALDSVGLASYNMDSHNCQRLVKSGAVTNEGDVQQAPAGPFPISYRSIVPRVGECENLLATFCLSGSHIAFSSCRMEPVFMITSQSAASAAVFAIDDGVAVQDVPYAKLRLQLLADQQVLTWAAAGTSTNGLVIDTEQGVGVTILGSWTTSTSSPGYNGAGYLHDGNAGKGARSVRFTPSLPQAGNYSVALRWTENANRASNVPITLTHAGGVTNLTVNQRSNGGVWFPLGTFYFEAGSAGNLLLENTGTDGFVIADATLWQPQQAPPPPTVEVIASDSVAAEDGPNPAVFAIVRSAAATNALTVAYTLSGTATPGEDFTATSGSLVIPPGQLVASVTILPSQDTLAEADETVTLTLATNAAYQLGAYTNASAIVHDGGFGVWATGQFTTAELADPNVSGPDADPDDDGIANLLEFFHGSEPKLTNFAPALRWVSDTNGWNLDWQRSPAAAGLFLRVEESANLTDWFPAPFSAQAPQVREEPPWQPLRFALGNPMTNHAQTFYRVAVSTTALPLVTNDAHFFFSFDASPDGSNAFQGNVTANNGFYGVPTVTRTGTALSDTGGATNFTDFTGVIWSGSGGAATPGHSLGLNNGSANNSFSVTFSTLGLRQVRLRLDIRSAAQAGGVAPTEFTSFTYDVGGGPQPVSAVGLSLIGDNFFHEWAADLSSLAAIDNQPRVTLTWTIKNLAASPAESFRVDNLQVTASPRSTGP
ncbi:MAG: FAD-dependent oxidoreductase [Verrucomicrobia bacterium]|nr:FAD-dependent oxidoreductase [Verrucomicrobiota bacterium]